MKSWEQCVYTWQIKRVKASFYQVANRGSPAPRIAPFYLNPLFSHYVIAIDSIMLRFGAILTISRILFCKVSGNGGLWQSESAAKFNRCRPQSSGRIRAGNLSIDAGTATSSRCWGTLHEPTRCFSFSQSKIGVVLLKCDPYKSSTCKWHSCYVINAYHKYMNP